MDCAGWGAGIRKGGPCGPPGGAAELLGIGSGWRGLGAGLILLLGTDLLALRLHSELQQPLAAEAVLGPENGGDAVAQLLAGLGEVTALAVDLLEVGLEQRLPVLQILCVRRELQHLV